MYRIQKLQKLLQETGIDCALITHPVDLYYLIGLKLSAGKLSISYDSVELFVDSRYIEACKKVVAFPVHLQQNNEPASPLFQFFEQHRQKTLAFDAENTSYQDYMKLLEQTQNFNIELIPLENLMKKVRMVKDSSEIDALKKAANLGLRGYEHICSLLNTGVKERELALAYEIFCLENGGEKLSFEPIIAFGANSSQPHYRSSDCILEPNNIVLIDTGFMLHSYCSDMTRTIFFGKPDERLKNIYNVVLEAQCAAVAMCKAGVCCYDVDQKARKMIADAGFGAFFGHGLGHGVGLDVHELPVLKNDSSYNTILEPGMVITIEPGIYLPDLGGVRIEDTVIITENGCEIVTLASKLLSSIGYFY